MHNVLLLLTFCFACLGWTNPVWAFLQDKNIQASEVVLDAIKPHKAIYSINLKTAKSGSQILDISGEMYYGWEASCEGWTTDHRFNLLYEYADSAPVAVKSDFKTVESFDGKQLDFNSRRKRAGHVFEEFRGQANVQKTKQGRVNYTLPEDLEHVLPQNTLLPVDHTIKVLEKANAGQRFFNAVIFDGSDEKGAYEVNAFIGKSKEIPNTELENVDSTLVSTKAWPVRMAFFPYDDKSSSPEYEMQMIFHENGLVSDMTIDYDDFSVTQKLVALEGFDWPDCP